MTLNNNKGWKGSRGRREPTPESTLEEIEGKVARIGGWQFQASKEGLPKLLTHLGKIEEAVVDERMAYEAELRGILVVLELVPEPRPTGVVSLIASVGQSLERLGGSSPRALISVRDARSRASDVDRALGEIYQEVQLLNTLLDLYRALVRGGSNVKK